MKYMLFVIDAQSNSGSPEEISKIDAFNAAVSQAGQLILAAGLASSARGIYVDSTNGTSQVEPGSLNGEVFYSGFWIVDVDSPETAISLAEKASAACNRRLELRPFL